jgi:nucleoside-diphosphate-sugar epimerase
LLFRLLGKFYFMNSVSIIGLGWMGKPLALLLQQKGFQVKGSTTSPEKLKKLQAKGFEAIHFSLNPHPEGTGFNALFQSEILVVNIPPKTRSGNGTFYLEQLKYLRGLIDNSQIRKVVLVSSTGIYPEIPCPVEYSEDYPITLENTGNETLLRAEQFMDQNRKYELTIVRFGGLMGEDRIPGKYFSGKENVTGHTRVNYIHQIDAVRILDWIIRQELWNDTFNGVSPFHPLRREIYEKTAHELGITPPKNYLIEEEGNDRLISSSKIIETGFEFEFPHPLEFTYLPPNP